MLDLFDKFFAQPQKNIVARISYVPVTSAKSVTITRVDGGIQVSGSETRNETTYSFTKTIKLNGPVDADALTIEIYNSTLYVIAKPVTTFDFSTTSYKTADKVDIELKYDARFNDDDFDITAVNNTLRIMHPRYSKIINLPADTDHAHITSTSQTDGKVTTLSITVPRFSTRSPSLVN